MPVTKYPVTLKNRGWSPLAAGVVTIALIGSWLALPRFFYLTVFLLAVIYGLSIAVRFLLMQRYELVVEGEWLIEYDFRGREMG